MYLCKGVPRHSYGPDGSEGVEGLLDGLLPCVVVDAANVDSRYIDGEKEIDKYFNFFTSSFIAHKKSRGTFYGKTEKRPQDETIFRSDLPERCFY